MPIDGILCRVVSFISNKPKYFNSMALVKKQPLSLRHI